MHTSIRQCVLFDKIFNAGIRIFNFLICAISGSAFCFAYFVFRAYLVLAMPA
ncbi:hypothetical protein KsCSTR_28050 [Candidatus Kuenenia stuttgartiensis]|uniref:Uncharacterized protein n=1 Tax=Kuenenia stuttgartiensis TaxID=174633 RepID=A0A6G7GS52_KUEST|nr:hypothetical protein KsCSTR_28050 [Candidatus Kuenenia stuttgartiensis]